MAQLALGITGAVIGGAVGGPVGASIGFSAGIFLGGVLWPPESTQVGSQLDDLKFTASTYGRLITRTYGTDRVAGNAIWGTDIVEVRTEETSGGKGGPKITTVNFSYFANVAVSFGEGDLHGAGEITFLQLLGDGKIMRDWTGTGPVGENGTIRTYGGSLTQKPDPLIVETEGTNRASAHRGINYVMYEMYPLADHGNRFPNVEAVITRVGAATFPKLQATSESTVGSRSYYSREQGIFYGNNDDGLSIFSVMGSGPQLLQQYGTIANTDPDIDGGVIVGSDGHSWAIDQEHKYFYRHGANGNYSPLYQIDVKTGRVFQQQGGDGPVAGQFPEADLIEVRKDYTKLIVTSDGAVIPERLIFKSAVFGGINMMFLPTFVQDFKAEPFKSSLSGGGIKWAVLDSSLVGWVLIAGTTTIGVHKLDPSLERNLETGGPLIEVPETATDHGILFDLSGTFTDTSTQGRDEAIMTYIDSWHALLIRRAQNIALFDIATETIIAFSEDVGPATSIDPKIWYSWARAGVAGDGRIGLPTGATPGEIGLLDLSTLKNTAVYDLNDWVGSIDWKDGAYESRLGAFIVWDSGVSPRLARILYLRDAGGGQDLDFILDKEITMTPLETGDLNLTAANPFVIDGYTVSRVGSAEANIKALLTFTYVDLIRSDNKLKAVARGGAVVRTVPEDDLGAHVPGDEPPPRWNRIRGEEITLPIAVTLTYRSTEREYKNDTQRYARTFEVAETTEDYNASLSIVMDANAARQWDQKTLSIAWTEQDQYETSLGPKWLLLEPSDVITVIEKGVSYRVRITEVDFGANNIIDLKAVEDDQDSYNAPITGDAGEFHVLKGIEVSVESIVFFIDNAPLRDQDMTLGTYMGVSPLYDFGGTYRGAVVRESVDDGATFEVFTTIQSASAHGIVVEAILDADFRFWDRASSLTVFWQYGSDPSSVTEAQALSGSGAYAIGSNENGWEIVNAVNVTANADGSFTFDTFLRGRAGSQAFTSTHAAGEYIVPLSTTNITRRATTSARLNVARLFRADTIGSDISKTATAFTNTGRAVRPQPVAGLYAYRPAAGSGAIVLIWRQTTGVNGEAWWNGIGLPVGDAYAAVTNYDVEVLDGPGGAVVLTKAAVAAETVTLTEDELNNSGIAEDAFIQDLQLTMLNPEFEIGTTTPANWTDISDPPANPDALTELDFGGGRVINPYEGSQFLLCSQDLAGPGDEWLEFINDDIDLVADGVSASAIDAGNVSIQFKCRLLFTSVNESFWLGFNFLDSAASGAVVLASQLSPEVSHFEIDVWKSIEFFVNVPAGTRAIEAKILANDARNVLVDDCELWSGSISAKKLDLKVYQNSDIYGRGQTKEENVLVQGTGVVQ